MKLKKYMCRKMAAQSAKGVNGLRTSHAKYSAQFYILNYTGTQNMRRNTNNWQYKIITMRFLDQVRIKQKGGQILLGFNERLTEEHMLPTRSPSATALFQPLLSKNMILLICK